MPASLRCFIMLLSSSSSIFSSASRRYVCLPPSKSFFSASSSCFLPKPRELSNNTVTAFWPKSELLESLVTLCPIRPPFLSYFSTTPQALVANDTLSIRISSPNVLWSLNFAILILSVSDILQTAISFFCTTSVSLNLPVFTSTVYKIFVTIPGISEVPSFTK